MTIKELIAKLLEFDLDADVYVHTATQWDFAEDVQNAEKLGGGSNSVAIGSHGSFQ